MITQSAESRKTDMAGIPRPDKCLIDTQNNCSVLYFPDGTHGSFHMRGGVCWPVTINNATGRSNGGYIILCGQEIYTKKIYVFEEMPFLVIDHILNPDDGSIQFEGISNWLNNNWAKYYADYYYHHEDELTHKRYFLQIIRSIVISPKPHMVEAPWNDDGQARQIIWEQLNLKRLFYRKDGELFQQLQRANSQSEQILPAIEALVSAINGIVSFPHRLRKAA